MATPTDKRSTPEDPKGATAQPVTPTEASKEPPAREQIFLRERKFPEPAKLFTFRPKPLKEIKDSCLVVIDTNELELPYKTQSRSLPDIEMVFRALVDSNRLRIPAQVAREFLDHYGGLIGGIAEVVHKAKESLGQIKLPDFPLLRGLDEYKALSDKWEGMKKPLQEYKSALGTLEDTVRGWYMDDPVSRIYALITEDLIVDVTVDRDELLEELDFRYRNNVPPGYKDKAKSDEGIGDFLIWKTILQIGRESKRPVAFVTGEKKSDWFIRGGGERICPRLELLDEFRRESGGQSFYIIQFSDLVEWFDVAQATVEDLMRAEEEQRLEIQRSMMVATPVTSLYPNRGLIDQRQAHISSGLVSPLLPPRDESFSGRIKWEGIDYPVEGLIRTIADEKGRASITGELSIASEAGLTEKSYCPLFLSDGREGFLQINEVHSSGPGKSVIYFETTGRLTGDRRS